MADKDKELSQEELKKAAGGVGFSGRDVGSNNPTMDPRRRGGPVAGSGEGDTLSPTEKKPRPDQLEGDATSGGASTISPG